ncbi:probable glutathione peroxidase 8 isoform X2 [Candoia aspera]|uniref:probable glutathione peroxidase 8 isoform X2 n=1 Tax=Candoia aspera TaxID=51853 RepID=UPI002FD7EB51
MEPSLPVATYTLKSSKLKVKVFVIFISLVLCTAILGLLKLRFLKHRDFYSFEVKDSKGRTISLEKYRGKILPKRNLSGISGNILSAPKVKL